MRKFKSALALLWAMCILSTQLLAHDHDNEEEHREGLWSSPLHYKVDLNDRNDDLFKVSLIVTDLGQDNDIYQFAATAPGTYQIMDIGRFVRRFHAYDGQGNQLAVTRVSTNQWRLTEPSRVARIEYAVAETWDTPVKENQIYPMAGTTLEKDHVVINGQAVFGYPKGMQNRPVHIYLEKPESWQVGTALETNERGEFVAESYDHVVDSPILLGTLSRASTQIRNCSVEIFAYSPGGVADANAILEALDDIVLATAAFLDGFPVDHYTFLYHFEDFSSGAWEHSYSSFYVGSQYDMQAMLRDFIPRTAAHEIFHMVTPLHIHSDRINPFNFVTPNPSEHIWLYEGVTEWAAGMMQFRAGLNNLEAYLNRLSWKLNINDKMDPNFTISQMGLESYSARGQQQWSNIYNRGALVAGLLDIHLLHRSGGKRGLREVIGELQERYGAHLAFSEQTFFEDFVKMTYPEIADFFADYIRGNKPLPIKHYYGLLGIDYDPAQPTGRHKASIGTDFKITSAREVVLRHIDPSLLDLGLREGDRVLKIKDIDLVNGESLQRVKTLLAEGKVGDSNPWVLQRDERTVTLQVPFVEKEVVRPHIFKVNENPGSATLELRRSWSVNL